MDYQGQCHCGLITAALHTASGALPLRCCACSYCRRQGAVWCSDPQGSAVLEVPANVLRYSFNTRTADFLICPACGVLVAVVSEIERATKAVLNARTLDDLPIDLASITVVNRDDETLDQRQIRRGRTWTPTTLQLRAPFS